MPILNEAQLEEIRQLNKARTQGKWWWNGYSDICTVVPKGPPLDATDPDEDGHGIAYIANIPQAPEFEGHGDELHNPETRANAAFIAACSEAVPNLLETVEAMRELLRDAVDLGFAQHARVCIGRYHPGLAEARLIPCNCGLIRWLGKVKKLVGEG